MSDADARDKPVKPSWMIDCMACGIQLWHLVEHTPEHLRVRCGDCGATETYALVDEQDGATCMVCKAKTWTIVEYSDEDHHVFLRCDECDEVAEIWLKGEENECDANDHYHS